MSSSLLRLLVAALVGLAGTTARADELSDIEKLFRSGDSAQALKRADAVIASQPRDARVRFYKGVMLADLQRQGEAVQTFKALTEDFPELPDPYNNLAVLYAAQGRLTLALQALQSALRNDPSHRAARENLGDVYFALALHAWGDAAALAKGDDAALQRKLQLGREVLPAAARASAASPG